METTTGTRVLVGYDKAPGVVVEVKRTPEGVVLYRVRFNDGQVAYCTTHETVAA